MGKMEGIRIENYGSLGSICLGKVYSQLNKKNKALGNFITIIGPSGTGKSTLADAFGFIADCLDKGVEEACDLKNRGGYERLISQGSSGPIKFELYYKETSNSSPITYELMIGLDEKKRPYVQEERLRQRMPNERYGKPPFILNLRAGEGYAYIGNKSGEKEGGGVEGDPNDRRPVNLSDNRKLGIATYGAMSEYTRIVDFIKFLKSWYLCYFSPDSAREEQMAAPQPYLNRTGSNINNVAHYMFREDKNAFKKILNDIQQKIRGIKSIDTDETIDKRVVLRFFENGFSEPFYWTRMSDGTLKLFAYYLLLHELSPRELVFIEEPENGLYHQHLFDLARELKKIAGTGFQKQLFVTTHSPFFVNALSAEDVWVLEKNENGFSSIKRAAEYEFVKEMVAENVTLGDLWYSQYFG